MRILSLNGVLCSEERVSRSLLAYDELRQHGVANVFHTAEQPGFCSDTDSESQASGGE